MKYNSFNVHINIENDAFAENIVSELTRLLREVADKLENGYAFNIKLRDINGNACGNTGISYRD